jgi:nitrite reductase (NO-forming)
MRKHTIRSMLTFAAIAITALAVVQLASARTQPQASASATTVSVTGKEFSFKLSAKSIARPGKVTFSFKNAGHMLHDFKINGKKTPLIKPGKTAKLAVSFTKKGSYHYLCTVPGHAAAGMKGTFTVR